MTCQGSRHPPRVYIAQAKLGITLTWSYPYVTFPGARFV
jgi:hypothetical protein